ncbi:MAG: phosphatidate cytidylyltransferase [Desulfuromonadales bacterium]|nr:phosphatidate cytidylyltransferase [Desulfuromonadales bacterium]
MTGVILLPLLILLVWRATPPLFCAAVTVIVFIALDELYRMALPPARRLEHYFAALIGAAIVPSLYLQNELSTGAFAAATLAVATLFLFCYRTIETVARDCATVLLGFLYLPLLLGHLVLLRSLPQGREWIFTVFLIVMLSDTIAYFVGTAIGKHRLYPAISPKKSVEGAIGGLLGGVFGACLAGLLWFPTLSWIVCAGIGLALGASGQIGDLFESMLKRSYGVKDSGRIIPGHGGLLDRLDSLIFAFPPAYYLVLWLQ